MVASVARLAKDRPDWFADTLTEARAIVDAAHAALVRGHPARLGAQLNANQKLLLRWGVSTDGIERACQLALEAGAVGAKLTGAGGGGCVLALAEHDAAPIVERWQEANLDAFSVTISA